MRRFLALVAAIVLTLTVVSPVAAFRYDRDGPSDPFLPYYPISPLEGCIYTMSELSMQKGINPPMQVIIPFCKSLVS